jgi:transposase
VIATQPADFQCGIDGLVAVCKRRLASKPRSGRLFVFINRNKTILGALVYENNGFWLMTKRLSKGKFSG